MTEPGVMHKAGIVYPVHPVTNSHLDINIMSIFHVLGLLAYAQVYVPQGTN